MVAHTHPLFFVGGMSKAAARRAARFGLPFYPPEPRPDLEEVYHEELARHGKQGFVYHPGAGNSMLIIDDDPKRAWEELAPFLLRELQEYTGWKAEGVPRPSEERVETIEDLQRQERFVILTPEQGIDRLRTDPDFTAVLHPLAGGIPLERAWESFRAFTDEVLPAVRGERAPPE